MRLLVHPYNMSHICNRRYNDLQTIHVHRLLVHLVVTLVMKKLKAVLQVTSMEYQFYCLEYMAYYHCANIAFLLAHQD